MWTVLALSAGMWVQGALGFGSAIVALPILVWGGLTLPVAVAAVLVSVVVQTAEGTWRFRDALVPRDVGVMLVLRMIGLPVGLALMVWLAALEPGQVRQAVGVVVLLAVALVAWDGAGGRSRREATARGPVEHEDPKAPRLARRLWTAVAGVGSGLMAGAVGMGGPALVLWANTMPWNARRTRVFLWCSFLLVSPLQLALMGWRFGSPIGWGALAGLAATPAVVAAGWLGSNAGDRLSPRQFRAAGLVLLALMGLASVVGPALSNSGGE